jgi:hypothetical protein
MRKSAIALLVLWAMLLAGPAHADPPERLLPPVPVEDTLVVGNCGFEVQIDVSGKQGEVLFSDSQLLIAPGQNATLTNLANSTTTTVNIAGSGRSTFVENEDGSATFTLVGTGNWLVFNVEDPSDPIKLVSGQFTITETYDADGDLVSSEEDFSQARVVNMCEVLA